MEEYLRVYFVPEPVRYQGELWWSVTGYICTDEKHYVWSDRAHSRSLELAHKLCAGRIAEAFSTLSFEVPSDIQLDQLPELMDVTWEEPELTDGR